MSLRLRAHVSATETEGGTVLLDEKTGNYWQLNSSGSVILRTLLTDGTAEQAAKALHERYPVDLDRALADVHALVDALRAARLVRS